MKKKVHLKCNKMASCCRICCYSSKSRQKRISTIDCISAAKYGHIDCLKYSLKKDSIWDEDVCTIAANGGKLECLKFLHENGCPWDVIEICEDCHHPNCRDYVIEENNKEAEKGRKSIEEFFGDNIGNLVIEFFKVV
jgi:hypothetical protein